MSAKPAQIAILKAPLMQVHDAFQEGFVAGQKQAEATAYANGFEAGKAAALKAMQTEAQDKICETTREAAKQLGFKEGKEAGLAAGKQEAKALFKRELDAGMQQLSILCAGLQKTQTQFKHEFQQQLQDDCLSIAMAVVCRLLGQQHAYTDYLRHNIQEAVKLAKTMQDLTLWVHPSDLPVVRTALNGSNVVMDVQSHHELAMGACVVQWPNGSLESQLNDQLQSLFKSLMDVRANFQVKQP